MRNEETDYESAIEYYPKKFPCPRCDKMTHGVMSGLYSPIRICNSCAVPTEAIWDGEETFFRDADGSVSLA